MPRDHSAIVMLIAVLSELSLRLLVNLCILLRFRQMPPGGFLPFIVCRPFDFPSLFQSAQTMSASSKPPKSSREKLVPLNHILVFPAHLVTQSANGAVFPPRL